MFKSKYRICSFILVLSMLCGCIAMAAEPTQNPATAQANVEFDAEAFGVLEGLNLLPQEVLAMNANAEFTRAQFIETLFTIAGYNREKYLSAEMPFIDVSADSPYRNAICGFYNLGFISGTGDGRFSPDDPITYGQAAKLTVDVLGYKKYAEKKYEGTNAPYVVMAKNLGLMPAISIEMQEKPLNAAEAVSVLYNTARCDVMEIRAVDSVGNVEHVIMENAELLQRLNKIYYGEGVLINNGIVSLNGKSADENVVYIGNKKLDTIDFDVTYMIGYSVKYFYKDLEKNDLLLYAMRDEENSDVVELKSDQLLINDPAYSRTNVVCDVNGNKTEYKIDKYADIVYNNAMDNVRLDFKLNSGWMRLIDNNSNGVFDYVIMEEYENLFITSVSEESEYLYDKYGNTINLKDYSNIKVFMRGAEVEFSDVPINRVVSVVKSGDKSNLFLYVNDAGIQSELQKITNRNGKTYYTFEGEEYCFSHSYEQLRQNPGGFYMTKFEIGGIYTIYLDKDGKIAEADGSTAGKLVYALVIGSKLSDEAFADADTAIIKMMLEDGTVVIAETNKKVKSQDNAFNETSVTGKQLINDTRYRKEAIVKVKLNKDNKIVEFYYPNGEAQGYAKDPATGQPYKYYHDPNPEHFVMNYKYYYDANGELTTEYQANSKMILVETVRRYFVSTNTIVFIKYTNSKDDVPYAVRKGGTTGSRMEIYDVDKNLNAGVVSTFSGIGGGLGNELMIIEEVCEVYDDDEVKLQISGFYQTRESTTESLALKHVTYTEAYKGFVAGFLNTANFPYSDLKRGDVIRFGLYNNKLSSIQPIARLSERPTDVASGAYGITTSSIYGGGLNGFIFSKVYAVGEQAMTFYTPENLKTDTDYNPSGYGKLTPMSFSEFRWQPVYITIYDHKTEEISYGEMRDVLQYMEPKADGTLPDDEHDVWAVAFNDRGHVRSLILVYY